MKYYFIYTIYIQYAYFWQAVKAQPIWKKFHSIFALVVFGLWLIVELILFFIFTLYVKFTKLFTLNMKYHYFIYIIYIYIIIFYTQQVVCRTWVYLFELLFVPNILSITQYSHFLLPHFDQIYSVQPYTAVFGIFGIETRIRHEIFATSSQDHLKRSNQGLVKRC